MNFIFEKAEEIKPNSLQLEFWRMNILAVSPKHNMLFIGCENKIFVFYFKNRWDSRDFDKPKVFQISQNPENLINQICLRTFQNKDYLMCVDMNAKLTMFDISNMENCLYELDNSYENIEDNSTWSLDVFADSEQIIAACGANNRKISMWNITNIWNPSKRISIDAHDNNIPCIKFSPCGEFIASTSIDNKLKIFSTKCGQEICYCPLSDWGWSVVWIAKSSVLNYGNYKSYKYKQKQKNPENPKYSKKSSINHKLNKYLLFVSESKKMKLIDPIGNYKEEIQSGEKIFQMKEIFSENKFLQNHTRISIVKHSLLLSLVIAVCTQSRSIFFREIYFDEYNNFVFDSIKPEFSFPGLILGMDMVEIKGLSPELDICQLYIVCKEKILSKVEIRKNYKTFYSLKDSFL